MALIGLDYIETGEAHTSLLVYLFRDAASSFFFAALLLHLASLATTICRAA
jgi:hypothetical protein